MQLLALLGSFLVKVLPFLAAFKLGGDRVKGKQDEADAKILEKQRNVKPVRNHNDVRNRVRKHKRDK